MAYGKIARLPPEVREQLNERLLNGEPGLRLVSWLNELPAVRRVLAEEFAGRPINAQNLTNWKQGGYLDWRRERQVQKYCAAGLKTPAAVPSLKDLTTLMAAQYLVMIRHRHFTATPARRWRDLQGYSRAVCRFRRVEIQGRRLELNRQKLEFNREKLGEQRKTMAGRVAEVLHTALAGVRARGGKTGAAEATLTAINRVGTVEPIKVNQGGKNNKIGGGVGESQGQNKIKDEDEKREVKGGQRGNFMDHLRVAPAFEEEWGGGHQSGGGGSLFDGRQPEGRAAWFLSGGRDFAGTGQAGSLSHCRRGFHRNGTRGSGCHDHNVDICCLPPVVAER